MGKSDLTISKERERILEDNARRMGDAIVHLQKLAREMEANGRTGAVGVELLFREGHAKTVRRNTNVTTD
jgi:uncharacterized Zn finger protein